MADTDEEGQQEYLTDEAGRSMFGGGLGVGPRPSTAADIPVIPREEIEHKNAFGAFLHDRTHVLHEHEEIPRPIAQYLIPGEQHALAMHYHPMAMVRADLTMVGALAAAVTFNVYAYTRQLATPLTVHVIWFGFLVVFLWWALQLADFMAAWFVVTPLRIIAISGVFRRKVQPLPMKRVRDMQLDQTSLGRVFGYGTLRMESLGTGHALAEIEYIPDAQHVYGTIWSILLPTKGRSPMPDEVT
jgi:membrane protein YdbS with pleckstrin-like domain